MSPQLTGTQRSKDSGQARKAPFKFHQLRSSHKLIKIFELECQECIITNYCLCRRNQLGRDHLAPASWASVGGSQPRHYLQHLLDMLLPLRFRDPVHVPLQHFDEISAAREETRRWQNGQSSTKWQSIWHCHTSGRHFLLHTVSCQAALGRLFWKPQVHIATRFDTEDGNTLLPTQTALDLEMPCWPESCHEQSWTSYHWGSSFTTPVDTAREII